MMMIIVTIHLKPHYYYLSEYCIIAVVIIYLHRSYLGPLLALFCLLIICVNIPSSGSVAFWLFMELISL